MSDTGTAPNTSTTTTANSAPNTGTAPPTSAQTDWLASAAPELRGHAQNHGWDRLPPHEAALKAIQSHREAQQLLGVPKDQLVRLPDPKVPDSVKQFWTKLGAPADPKEYDFSGIKFEDGTPLDDKTADFLRQTFAEVHLPKETAARVSQALVKYMDSLEKAEMAERTAKLQEAKERLDKNWGVNKEANLFIARQGAARLGVKPVEVDALEQVIGYDRVMEMFLNIGKMAGEARFVTSETNVTGVMSVDQAAARKAELMRDQVWVTRYLNGDAEANKEMQALNKILTQGMTFNPLTNSISKRA